MKNLFLAVFSSILLSAFPLSVPAMSAAPAEYVPTPENVAAREEFRDNKFGIFLHWGLYSMLASGEWTMNNHNLNYKEYAKLAGGFYPAKFDAAKWVAAIKASGARYICFTTRHHDGFSMFGTKLSDFNIVDATPFGRDVLKELADECRKQGVKLHLYYSHIDWSREDAPRGATGRGTGRPAQKEAAAAWKSYYAFMNGQLTELLTNYGEIGAIWFDGFWDQKPNFNWQIAEQYALIHRLQPACLIANNHHRAANAGEDIQVFERDLPGQNRAGYSGQLVSALPLETCETMNGMWGYKISDQNYKSAGTLIRYLVSAAGRNANLLMNIGPQPDGELPEIALERLAEVGEWLKIYGETIYGTRDGNVPPQTWGVTTRKENRLFVHILDWSGKKLFVPLGDGNAPRQVLDFLSREPLEFRERDGGIELTLKAVPAAPDTVVELVF